MATRSARPRCRLLIGPRACYRNDIDAGSQSLYLKTIIVICSLSMRRTGQSEAAATTSQDSTGWPIRVSLGVCQVKLRENHPDAVSKGRYALTSPRMSAKYSYKYKLLLVITANYQVDEEANRSAARLGSGGVLARNVGTRQSTRPSRADGKSAGLQ